jgi:HEAT repeats
MVFEFLKKIIKNKKQGNEASIKNKGDQGTSKIEQNQDPDNFPLLKSESWEIRSSTAESLGKTNDLRAVEPLINLLIHEKVIAVRRSCARSLGALGDNRAVDPLKSALYNADEYSRIDIAQALEKLNWEPSDDLDLKVKYFLGLAQWDKCIEIGTSAAETLINIYYNENGNPFARENRWKAKKTLMQIGSPAIEPLILRLETSNYEIKKLIVDILKEFDDPRAKAAISEFLEGKQNIIDNYKKALTKYWKYNAKAWWKQNSTNSLSCDWCMTPITSENSYYKGGYMCCKSCVEDSLKSWDENNNDVDYFGTGEINRAMNHQENA